MWLINPKEISLNKLTNDVIDRYMGQYEKGWNDCIDSILEDIQRIEAEPVRHGRWGEAEIIGYNGYHAVYARPCMLCGSYTREHKPPYCSNCGAKMDGESG